jgi:hypothetical protein
MGKKCIPGVVCFENITILVIFIVVLLFFYYFSKGNNAAIERQQDHGQILLPPPPLLNPRGGFVFNNSVVMQPRMNDTLLDPYNPPLIDNSPPFMFNNPTQGRILMPINIPTQGSMMEQYIQVGLLTRANGSEMILPLMGQQLYTSRDKWNYYTMSDKNNIVKLPIYSRGKSCMSDYGCDSLSSGDHVHVEGYNDKFKVTVYDNRLTRYLPVY